MDVFVTYQQDTIQLKNLLKVLPETGEPAKLNIRRAPVSLEAIPERDTTRIVKDTTPPPPTFAQIRYWRWLREQKMLVDTSRYIQPRNHVKLVSNVKVDDKGLGLPMLEFGRINNDWITIVLLLILILFASIRNSYSKYMSHLFQSVVNYSTSFRMFREKNYPLLHGAYRLELYFYFTISVFLYQVFAYFQLEFFRHGILFFTLCLGVVFAYFFGKKLIYLLLGSMFEGRQTTSEFLFNMDNFNRVAGLFLFPIITLTAFYPFGNPVFPVVLGIITVAVFYLLLLQRGILILLKKQFSLFYLFLYLCILEFLPLLLIYKVVVE
jgi:hypothetical protein